MTISPNSDTVIVKLLTMDRVIHNLSEALIDISAAMHSDKNLLITMSSEGPALSMLTYRIQDNFLSLLENLCLKMSYDPKRIEISTGNLIEDVQSKFKIKSMTAEGWFYGEHLIDIKIDPNKNFKYHFGNFVSNSTYPRLLLASYLHTHHQKKSLQTYRRDPRDPGHAVNFDLDRMMFECADPSVLTDVSKFINHLPLELEHGLTGRPEGDPSVGGDAINQTILGWYNSFFCDVVTETYFSGKTFWLSEKTMRPLLCRNPFLAHGPKHFLTNLRDLGFKTFGEFWSEKYDDFEGYARCRQMYEIVEEISRYDIDALKSLHGRMSNILEHNRQRMITINHQDFKDYIRLKH